MKLKHKISLLVIGILLVVSLLISSSYALWVFNVSQESTNILVSDCFEITLTDNNPIGLGASFPMKDGEGVQTTPYTFTIRNICNHPADFQINLETLNTSTIDESFIKADLNGHITEYNAAESVETTIDGAKSAAMLYEDTLAVNGEKTYNLRLWVNESATQEDVENKSYSSKISVKATVRKQFAEGTLINGKNFNEALKTLADGGNQDYLLENTSITSIEWSNNAPQESDNAINIAADGTTTPIYAWFKDGTVYINSELDKIYMNPNSMFMFINMSNVINLDLSHFDTSNVTNMSNMFSGMNSLTNLDVSYFNTSNVTDMSYMFSGMKKLTNLDLSSFDTSNVEDMSWMFAYMNNLTSLDISHFDTSKVTNMGTMFYKMSSLKSLDVSNFDTSKVYNMSSMFQKMNSLETLDLSSFNTSKVNDMSYMFDNNTNLTKLNISNFDTSIVKSMAYMFNENNSLETLDLSSFDTSNVNDMTAMFYGVQKVKYLDLSNFNTSKVTNMMSMFAKMNTLEILNISNFNTSNVTDMSYMFNEDSNLKALDLSNFDTSNVTNMHAMFYETKKLETLDVSSFNTSNVTNMHFMFYDLDSLLTLDISSFDTSNVTDMKYMFGDAQIMTTIYVGNKWSTSKVSDGEGMFLWSTKIVGGSGTRFDENHMGMDYARVDGGTSSPGYFTLKTN